MSHCRRAFVLIACFLSDFSSEPVTCNHKDFACANGDCISSRFRCDGDSDCLDNSDEASMRCVFVCVHACECVLILCEPEPKLRTFLHIDDFSYKSCRSSFHQCIVIIRNTSDLNPNHSEQCVLQQSASFSAFISWAHFTCTLNWKMEN